ncbi:alpha/beta hydrolase [Salirhabdus salicampi]|uniref:alpha/beta hydrolase n=1 Tax=Salirhabdus salicampi TaxID=476102 RepID=UPI0020C494DC|nr:alpha/beta hydrolase [Salirhabdus salicampi]MCP8617808.1 lysophospholipase [Salirhabdus salicampi]
MKKLLHPNGKGAVVIIHGAFEHSGRYEWLATQLQRSGLHVIYGDLPGQGKSVGPKGHIDTFQQYIDTVAIWISEAEKLHVPVYIIGHSMGGLITIRLLQTIQPTISGVVLSSPGLGIKSKPPKFLSFISVLLDKVIPRFQVATKLDPTHSTRNSVIYDRDLRDPLYLEKVSVRWYHEFERSIEQAFRNIHHYPNVPTLIMQAGYDLLVNEHEVKHWFDLLPIEEKQYKQWDNLYHEIFNEPERDEVFAYMIDFINQLNNPLRNGG